MTTSDPFLFHGNFSKMSRSVKQNGLWICSVVLLSVVTTQITLNMYPAELSSRCSRPHPSTHNGDCQAIGAPRRPSWDCLSEMHKSLPEFLKLYEKRPLKENEGGMRVEHSFALWYILRKLRPRTVIESGARFGHSTWLIKQAVPGAKIYSIDPGPPKNRLRGVEYYVGSTFKDFSKIDWKSKNIDVERTLVFVDDHQNSMKRIFKDNTVGFKHFIIEDNYPYQKGDLWSLKTTCEVKRWKEWKGINVDNFGKSKTNMTWEEHIEQGKKLNRATEIYYEFPPIAPDHFVHYNHRDTESTTTPVVTDVRELDRLIQKLSPWEFYGYNYLAYVKIRSNWI